VPRYYCTKLQVQALTVGGRNKLVVKISWIMLKSQVKDRLTLKLKGEGKISQGQDFDCGRSSPYSACLGDTPLIKYEYVDDYNCKCTACEHCSYHCMQPPCDLHCNLLIPIPFLHACRSPIQSVFLSPGATIYINLCKLYSSLCLRFSVPVSSLG